MTNGDIVSSPKKKGNNGNSNSDIDFVRVKPKDQVPIMTFWSYMEPYFRPVTEEDREFLLQKVKAEREKEKKRNARRIYRENRVLMRRSLTCLQFFLIFLGRRHDAISDTTLGLLLQGRVARGRPRLAVEPVPIACTWLSRRRRQ